MATAADLAKVQTSIDRVQAAKNAIKPSDAPTPPPPKPTVTLPSWVPQPGVLADLTSLAPRATFSALTLPTDGFTGFYDQQIPRDQSSVFGNPYYGDLGGVMVFGGGHAGTNNNAVRVLELAMDGVAWKRVTKPVDLTATGIPKPWDQTKLATLGHVNKAWAEYAPNGIDMTPPQPCSGHTWDAIDVIPPALGGAAMGSIVTVLKQASNYESMPDHAIVAHRLDINDATDAQTWARACAAPIGSDGNYPAASCTALDTKRNRVWMLPGATANAAYLRVYDVAMSTYGQVTVKGPSKPVAASVDSGSVAYDEAHDILIYSCCGKGAPYKFAYLDCANPAAGWTVPTFAGDAIAVSAGGGPAIFGYCPDNDRWHLFGGRGALSTVYEVQIGADPSQPWQVVKRDIGASLPANIWITGTLRYLPKVKCFVFFTYQSEATYSIMAYRPANT